MAKTAVAKPTVLDDSLYAEAKAFRAATGKAKGAHPEALIDNLAMVRDAGRRLELDYKERTEKIKEKLAPFDADKKALKKVFDEADEAFSNRLLDLLKAKEELPAETSNGTRLTIALLNRIVLREGYAWASELVFNTNPTSDFGDYSRIPSKYIKPLNECIDWKAVEKDITANAALVEAGEPPKYDVGFAEVTQQISLRPKLPEV